jgi:predicted Holliday junction resolvase-like endonuclease
MTNQLNDIIKLVKEGQFKAKCPSCTKIMDFEKVPLFTTKDVPTEVATIIGYKKQQIKEQLAFASQKTEVIVSRQVSDARSVNRGLIVERMLPLLKGFRFDRNDCRSIFNPIDYIIFDGLHKTGKVKKIYFAEVKSGNSKVSPKQSLIAKRISEKKVRFVQY